MTSSAIGWPCLLRIEGTDSQSQIFPPYPHRRQPRVFLRGGVLWFPLCVLLTRHGRASDSLGPSQQTSRRCVREYSSSEDWAFGHLPDRTDHTGITSRNHFRRHNATFHSQNTRCSVFAGRNILLHRLCVAWLCRCWFGQTLTVSTKLGLLSVGIAVCRT
jgi:hypothetical protein